MLITILNLTPPFQSLSDTLGEDCLSDFKTDCGAVIEEEDEDLEEDSSSEAVLEVSEAETSITCQERDNIVVSLAISCLGSQICQHEAN